MAEMRDIVRVATVDVRGHLPIYKAIWKIKGVGHMFSNAVLTVLEEKYGIDRNEKVGMLTDEQLDKIEEIIKNPTKFNIPTWLINRRFDPTTGEDKHLIGTDLDFAIRQDIVSQSKMGSYRGWRHKRGQKVRGQRTKSTGRFGRTLGVVRKKGGR